MNYWGRIKQLEKKYSETNISKGEELTKETKRRINKNYYDNQQRRLVDAMLNNVKNKDSIKEEVHDIVKNTQLKSLCYRCTEEYIIAVIILYCQRSRNHKYMVERTALWKKYGITWRKYGLIVERLLQQSRAASKIKTDVKVDNEDFIRW